MVDTLGDLTASGVTLAVVSSNSRANVVQVLSRDNAETIQFLECSASVFGKAARLRRVLKASGHAPSRAVHTGGTDLKAAREVRMAADAVTWGCGDINAVKRHASEEIFEAVVDLRRIVGVGSD